MSDTSTSTESNEATEGDGVTPPAEGTGAGTQSSEDAGAGQSSDSGGSDDTGLKAEVEKWKALARKHEKESNDRGKALKTIEDKDKTELQRVTEAKAELEVQLAELRVTNVRREAAEAAGLPAQFVKFITGAEPTEALEQAKELAKALKATDADGRQNGGTTDLRQGARGSGGKPRNESRDDLIRRMAGL